MKDRLEGKACLGGARAPASLTCEQSALGFKVWDGNQCNSVYYASSALYRQMKTSGERKHRAISKLENLYISL